MEKSIYTAEYAVLLTLLRETRRRAGITQTALAKLLHESQSQISKLERGEVRIDMIELRTILRVLGSSLPAFVAKLEKRLAAKSKGKEAPKEESQTRRRE